ncbi:DNA-directed RNA polymerase subunit A'' [Halobaculum sp. MBLA0147]|uniref:DNA-directed RNA polymerase subunit A'' n=1 Tax=Halobaculum sp. MBLA0147 TaxID=3079934 RepID=UPI0035239928
MTETAGSHADDYEHVTDEMALVVEDTELPRRLKDEVYETIEGREGEITVEQADEIAQATESRYVDTRVDPLDPVGTVSAQSIGEPGTQMSIPHDERVVVRRDGQTDVTEIGPLVDEIVAARESRDVDGHEVALAPDSLAVPSLRSDGTLTWKPVEEVSRHDAPDELLEFELESSRSIRATKAHSFVVERDDEIVPIRGDELEVGTELPVTGDFDRETASVGLEAFETVATDGAGAVAVGGSAREILGEASWDPIDEIRTIETDHEYVYDFSVAGLETFTTAEGVVTHNTMNTFHFAGVAEMDVTQGLPRLIELVDARKEPDTPVMEVHLEGEYAHDREKAHEVVWEIEATQILALGDVSTNVADMRVSVDLNEETLLERWPTFDDAEEVADIVADTIESSLGVETVRRGTVVQFGPEQPSYRELLQLVEQLREITFKGIEEINRVVIRKEETDDDEEEFVLYTEGSAFSDALEIEGVDASRTTCNNIHEIYRTLGVEAARESIIDETMNTLEEQGLDDVNVRHLMLVADIMTNQGTVESIGRHGISGSKESVLARAAFEVTVNHLLDAAIQGEVDDLDGVIENVIAGKPVAVGTGDVDLRMGSTGDAEPPSADD